MMDLSNLKPGDKVIYCPKYTPREIKTIKRVTATHVILGFGPKGDREVKFNKRTGKAIGGESTSSIHAASEEDIKIVGEGKERSELRRLIEHIDYYKIEIEKLRAIAAVLKGEAE